MKRISVPTILAVSLFLVGGVILPSHAPMVRAAPIGLPSGSSPCSIHELAGRWGYTYSGAITAGPAAGPAASVGSFAQDPAGNIKGSQTRSFNGDVENETLSGTVSLNSDCTAVVT
jgi:hypothetical protein